MNLYRQFCNIPPITPNEAARSNVFSRVHRSVIMSVFLFTGRPHVITHGYVQTCSLGDLHSAPAPCPAHPGSQHLRLKKPSCYFWLLKRSAYGKKEVISVNSLDYTIVLNFPSKCYKCYVTGQHYLTKYIQKIGKCLVCRSSQENRNSITHSHF